MEILEVRKIETSLRNPAERETDTECFTAGTIVYHYHEHTRKLRVLLVRRSGKGSWTGTWEIPGGSCNRQDATIIDTALREAKEETNIEINPKTLSPSTYKSTFKHKGKDMFYFTFKAKFNSAPSVQLSNEHDEYGFFDKSQLDTFEVTTSMNGDPRCPDIMADKNDKERRVMLETKYLVLCQFFKDEEQAK